MVSPLREELQRLEPFEEETAPVVRGTTRNLSKWVLPMTALGLLLMFTFVLFIVGQMTVNTASQPITRNTSSPEITRNASSPEITRATSSLGTTKDISFQQNSRITSSLETTRNTSSPEITRITSSLENKRTTPSLDTTRNTSSQEFTRITSSPEIVKNPSSLETSSNSSLLETMKNISSLETTANKSPYKGYSGIRVRLEAERKIYYYEQTIAVVEVGRKGELYNCELIEVSKPRDLKEAIFNLTSIGKPFSLTMEEMVDLVSECSQLPSPLPPDSGKGGGIGKVIYGSIQSIIPSSLIHKILPGTKWCGVGNLAKNYFDLGKDESLDRCCRAHDYCPVKVLGFSSRYNLTNDSKYTRSHCLCDLNFKQCLEEVNKRSAHFVGNVFYNVVKMQCVRLGKDYSVFYPAGRYR